MYGHNKDVPLKTLTVCREDTHVHYNENILCRGYGEREGDDAPTEYRVGEDGRDRRKGIKF